MEESASSRTTSLLRSLVDLTSSSLCDRGSSSPECILMDCDGWRTMSCCCHFEKLGRIREWVREGSRIEMRSRASGHPQGQSFFGKISSPELKFRTRKFPKIPPAASFWAVSPILLVGVFPHRQNGTACFDWLLSTTNPSPQLRLSCSNGSLEWLGRGGNCG